MDYFSNLAMEDHHSHSIYFLPSYIYNYFYRIFSLNPFILFHPFHYFLLKFKVQFTPINLYYLICILFSLDLFTISERFIYSSNYQCTLGKNHFYLHFSFLGSYALYSIDLIILK